MDSLYLDIYVFHKLNNIAYFIHVFPPINAKPLNNKNKRHENEL